MMQQRRKWVGPVLGIAIFAMLQGCASARANGDLALAATAIGTGQASYFADEMAGNRTASGAICDPDTLTAAHRTLPFGSRVLVTNPANGDSVVVTVNDRGPYARGRIIDLSRAAAKEIGLYAPGHGEVELSLLPE